MKTLSALSLASALAVIGAVAPAEAGKALVVCIENDNANPFLDKAFESLAATQMAAHAKKYDVSAVIKNCGTKKFKDALKKFAEHTTDIATLVHGSQNAIALNSDQRLDKGAIAKLGALNKNIRAVFQLNCWGSYLRDAWISAGAKAVTGSRKLNTRVMAYDSFFKAWLGGKSFGRSVNAVNEAKGGAAQQIINGLYKVIKQFGSSACCGKCSGNFLEKGACNAVKSVCRGALNTVLSGGADKACYFAKDVDSTFLTRGTTSIKF